MHTSYTITKRVSKHGQQAVIVIPKLLQDKIGPGTLAEIRITLIEEAKP